jgi:hypothetical protein
MKNPENPSGRPVPDLGKTAPKRAGAVGSIVEAYNPRDNGGEFSKFARINCTGGQGYAVKVQVNWRRELQWER